MPMLGGASRGNAGLDSNYGDNLRVETLFEALATYSEIGPPRLKEPTRGCARTFLPDYKVSKSNLHEVPGKVSLCVLLEF